MHRLALFSAGLFTLLTTFSLLRSEPTNSLSTEEARSLAHRAWVLTDVVLSKHIEPPTRQEMLLWGLKGILRAENRPITWDLGDRVVSSRLSNETQYAKLLQESWPQGIKTEQIESALVQAMLMSIPGQPNLISPPELKVQRQFRANRYVGTGIQGCMNDQEQLMQIVLALPGGPARKAGAKPNDLIVAVDGVSMQGRTIKEVVDRLRGEEGTLVTMTVRQPGSTETRPLKLIRSVVPFAMVTGYRRTGEESWDYHIDPTLPIAYVRINSITSSTAHDLRKLEPRLLAEGIRAVMLDLRFITARDLQPTAQVADELIDGGLLWRVLGRDGQSQEFHAIRDCLFRDLPLAILVRKRVHGDTSILLAAALQEHRHALIVGETIASEVWVTSLVDLPEGLGALSLRTGVTERLIHPETAPEGRPTNRIWEVKPDHEVAIEAIQWEALSGWIREQESPDRKPESKVKPPEDPQLAKALEVLRNRLEQQR